MRKFLFAGVMLTLMAAQSWAQRTITGKVTDDKGSPLPNVSVLVKGTTQGTATKDDGSYSLNVSANARTLIFSSTSMNTVEVAIGNSNVINTTLTAASSSMDEVIVVGYGTQKKRDLTSNVATVKGGVTADKPVQTFDQALGGRAAGVQITIPNGVVNSPPVFRIRGTNSISLSSYPLIIVDGVPSYTGDYSSTSAAGNVLASINPNDIEV